MDLTIYKQIARDALMSWNGLSEDEATKKVQESSNEELEAQVYAEGSIDAAIRGFQKYSQEYLKNKHGYGQPISEYDVELFKEIIMTGNYRNGPADDFFKIARKQMGLWRNDFNGEQMLTDTTNMVISVLSTIHDGWVQDNQKKFFARDKKYQHMPIELIGWKEAKSDLLFLKPILEAMHLSDWASEEDLEKAYNQRVQAFLEEKGITDITKLSEQISRGADFYPALEEQDDIIQALQDTEFVEQQVVSGIRDKGIGTNEQFAQQLFREKIDKEEHSGRIEIQSMKDVERMIKNSSQVDIDEVLFPLQEYASKVKNVKSIRKIYNFIGELTEHLKTDGEKLMVLANIYGSNMQKLHRYDEEHSYPAEPADRIYAHTEYSFEFIDRIVNSLEDSSKLKRIQDDAKLEYDPKSHRCLHHREVYPIEAMGYIKAAYFLRQREKSKAKSVQDLGKETLDIQKETAYIDATQESIEREQKALENKDKDTQELQ